MKKISLKDIKNAMSRDEMRNVKGAGCAQGCNLTVAACWNYNHINRNNAFQGPNGWQCCPK